MVDKFVNFVFYSRPLPRSLGMTKCLILFGVYLVGIFHWLMFFDKGKISFEGLDWPKEFKYYSILKRYLTDGQIPYYISAEFQDTNRFLALPETVFSPQIFLLKYLEIGTFFQLHVLILYSVCFLGCLLISRKYKLSLFAFGVLFLLINLNGHITTHLSVGHSSWGGYFLLPFFLYWVLEMTEGNCSLKLAGKLALCLLFILLQGSLHVFIWCLLFLGSLLILEKNLRIPIVFVMVFAGSLVAFRLVPAAVTFFGKEHDFMLGFPTLYTLFEGLVQLKELDYSVPLENEVGVRIGWWEFDHYIGVLGLGVIAYFGIWLRFQNARDGGLHVFKKLDLPLVLMAILSLSYIFGIVARLPIPLINVERVPARFFIIPLLMLSIISCIRMQDTFDRVKIDLKMALLMLAGIVHAGFSLGAHSLIWRVSSLEKVWRAGGLEKVFYKDFGGLTVPQVIAPADDGWIYILSIKVSYCISLIALLSVLYVCFFHNGRISK